MVRSGLRSANPVRLFARLAKLTKIPRDSLGNLGKVAVETDDLLIRIRVVDVFGDWCFCQLPRFFTRLAPCRSSGDVRFIVGFCCSIAFVCDWIAHPVFDLFPVFNQTFAGSRGVPPVPGSRTLHGLLL